MSVSSVCNRDVQETIATTTPSTNCKIINFSTFLRCSRKVSTKIKSFKSEVKMHQEHNHQLSHHQLWSGEAEQLPYRNRNSAQEVNGEIRSKLHQEDDEHIESRVYQNKQYASHTYSNHDERQHHSSATASVTLENPNNYDDLKASWLNQRNDKQLEQDKERNERKLFLDQQEELRSRHNSAQAETRSRIEEEQMDLKHHLDDQVAELKQKEKAGRDVRVNDAMDMRNREIAHNLEDVRKQEEKVRLARECVDYNREAARLKKLQKAKEAQAELKFDQDLNEAMRRTDLEDAEKREKLKEERYEELHLLQMQANDDIMRRNEHKLNKSNYDNQIIEIHDNNQRRQQSRRESASMQENLHQIESDINDARMGLETAQLREYQSELDELHREEDRVEDEIASIESRRDQRDHKNRDFF